MRVVIDCNVLVSAARPRGTETCAKVIDKTIRDHEVVLSEPIVDEYEAIAERSAHASHREGILAIIGELERVAAMVEPADAAFGAILMMKSIWRPQRPATRSWSLATAGISRSRDTDRSRFCPRVLSWIERPDDRKLSFIPARTAIRE